MKYYRFVILFLLSTCPVFAQSGLLKSGPMVGYSAMREVMLWAQTSEAATVHFEYWEKGKPQQRAKTDRYTTKKAEEFTVHIAAAQLEPGIRYEYEIFINGKKVTRPYPLEFQTQELWQWRKDPPAFKFIFGSCNFVNEPAYDRPGKGYGGDYEIFNTIIQQKPDFMLWGGDNVYLREPDFDSRSGIMYRYTHDRTLAELQPLLGSMHHYAVWDDHDFGPNDSDRSYPLKEVTLEAFKLFWANPNYGLGTGAGVNGTFTWGDVQFFLLDNRYFKTPNDNHAGDRTMIGEEQFNWLIDALTTSRATFKFIVMGGQVISNAAVFENYSTYNEERERLIRTIRKAEIRGVMFLTGDRHHTEVSMLQENNKVYPLYDFTVSPFTSGIHDPGNEGNTLQVPGTLVNDKNFALMEVSGPAKARVLKVTIIGTTGKVYWTKEFAAKDLQ